MRSREIGLGGEKWREGGKKGGLLGPAGYLQRFYWPYRVVVEVTYPFSIYCKASQQLQVVFIGPISN
jgi:hypothetical protein